MSADKVCGDEKKKQPKKHLQNQTKALLDEAKGAYADLDESADLRVLRSGRRLNNPQQGQGGSAAEAVNVDAGDAGERIEKKVLMYTEYKTGYILAA